MLKLKLQYLGHLMWRPTHWKRPWFWERLKVGEGDNKEWDGWMASPTQWMWAWVDSRSSLKPMSIELVTPSNHLILPHPLLLPPSIFPSIRAFSNESVLCIRWPTIGVSASASVLPMIIQDWFPLRWMGWISFSPRDSQESSTPQFKSINSSVLSLLYSPTLTSINDYWKNHRFD